MLLQLILLAEELAKRWTLSPYLTHQGRLKLDALLSLHLILCWQGANTVSEHLGVFYRVCEHLLQDWTSVIE